MNRHRFDPLSFCLGILAVGIGLFVAAGAFDGRAADIALWATVAVLVMGIAVIPWGGRTVSEQE